MLNCNTVQNAGITYTQRNSILQRLFFFCLLGLWLNLIVMQIKAYKAERLLRETEGLNCPLVAAATEVSEALRQGLVHTAALKNLCQFLCTIVQAFVPRFPQAPHRQ